MIHCGDIAILIFQDGGPAAIFQDGGPAAILDSAKLEIAPYDTSTPKTPSYNQTRSKFIVNSWHIIE